MFRKWLANILVDIALWLDPIDDEVVESDLNLEIECVRAFRAAQAAPVGKDRRVLESGAWFGGGVMPLTSRCDGYWFWCLEGDAAAWPITRALKRISSRFDAKRTSPDLK